MSDFSEEEQEIIENYLSWYELQTDIYAEPSWILSYVNNKLKLSAYPFRLKKSLQGKNAISIDLENSTKITSEYIKSHPNDPSENTAIFKEKLKNKVRTQFLIIFTVINKLENKNLIFRKDNLTFEKLFLPEETQITHIDNELNKIYSSIIPSGTLLKLRENNYKSQEQIQHEEQIKLLKDQLETDKAASKKQTKQLKGQNLIAYCAVMVSLLVPAVNARKPTEVTVHNKTSPLPIAISSDKIDALNQEVLNLEAKVTALKLDIDKAQKQLSQPKQTPAKNNTVHILMKDRTK